jgi:hypothetical protein
MSNGDTNDTGEEWARLWGFGIDDETDDTDGTDDVGWFGDTGDLPTQERSIKPQKGAGWGYPDHGDTDGEEPPESDLQPDEGFYHSGVHVKVGRVFADPHIERGDEYVGVREIEDRERMIVSIIKVREHPDGHLESRHGCFFPVSPAQRASWPDIHGRLIPR